MTDSFQDDFDIGAPKDRQPETDPFDRAAWAITTDIDEATYYADNYTPQPAISCSKMGKLLNETPLDFAFDHPRLNPDPEKLKDTIAKIRGDVVHQLALGKGRGYAVGDFKTWQSNDAKAFKENAEAQGLTPIKRADFEEAEVLATVVRERIEEVLEGSPYETEVAFWYQEMTAAGPIWVRGKLDVWCEEKAIILDPKVTARLYDDQVDRQLVSMGWDRQAALYPHAIGTIRPELAGRIRFADLMVKPEPPYTSRLVTLEGAFEASAIRQCKIAFERFGACLYAGKWPGFGNKVDVIPIPQWEARKRGDLE
jgi:hypothetical protein